MIRPLLLASLLCSALALADAPVIPDLGAVALTPRPSTLSPDWKYGPFMEVYVRGYQDSNGDGHGDLNGLISRLDYLQQLGVTGLWLMPVNQSEDHNHGYAVKNYRDIESRYGKLADFRRLLDEAHRRGIGIIMDYVMNHSADTHPLFVSASHRDSPYRDWYVWQEGERPQFWKGLNEESWYDKKGSWYFAVFWERMPDFNLKNPAVQQFHEDNLRFWLNEGVDGFRFDAVSHLVENGPDETMNQPENYRLMATMRDLVHNANPNGFTVCEAPSDPVGFTKACGSAFAFGLQTAIVQSAKQGRADRQLLSYLDSRPVGQMSPFLGNHDFFAGKRVFSALGGDLAAYRTAAATLLMLPGTPFLYYGEEIGMDKTSGSAIEDEQLRAPMAWSAEEKQTGDGEPVFTFGGFTRLTESRLHKLFRPLPDNAKAFNVADEEKDPHSLLNFYRQLIALRRAHPALMRGQLARLTPYGWSAGKEGSVSQDLTADDRVLAFLRETDGKRLLVLINYADKNRPVSFKDERVKQLQPVWPKAADQPVAPQVTVPAQSLAVYRLP